MAKITYRPEYDPSPESKREFNIGSRVVTIDRGENYFDDNTLIHLEQFGTFREGEDKWFLVDRQAQPPLTVEDKFDNVARVPEE